MHCKIVAEDLVPRVRLDLRELELRVVRTHRDELLAINIVVSIACVIISISMCITFISSSSGSALSVCLLVVSS